MRYRLGLVGGLVLSLGVGCGDEFDMVEFDTLESNVSGLITTNSLVFNGLGSNQLQLNGIAVNQLQLNQLQLNQLQLNQLQLNQLQLNGKKTTWDQRGKAETLFRYMAECALQPGQSVTYKNRENKTKRFHGALGLAPYWETMPLYPFPKDYTRGSFTTKYDWEQRKDKHLGEARMTACLAARTNAKGQPVTISMRGLRMQTAPGQQRSQMPELITRSTTESRTYSDYEAMYFGNIFSQPYNVSYSPGHVHDASLGRSCGAAKNAGCEFEWALPAGDSIDVHLDCDNGVMSCTETYC